jgi:Phage integrase, N-terminal SAM-like domain
MRSQGHVYSWCGCRDGKTGRLGSRCPRRGTPGHGSWYVCVELPAGPDGGRHRARRGGFPDEHAARDALDRLAIPSPGQPAERLITTGRWLARWLDSQAGIRYSTLRSYESHIRRYLDPYLGRILLADLRTVHVQAMFTAIARRSATGGHPVTAATLTRIRATLRAALNAAIRAGHLTANPATAPNCPGPGGRGPSSGQRPGSPNGRRPGAGRPSPSSFRSTPRRS